MKRFWLTSLFVAALFCLAPFSRAEAVLTGSERVICIGDSITHSGAYSTDLQLLWLLRHPGSKLTVLNAGIAGDTLAGALERLDYDILPQKPNVAFILFGINDIRRHLYKTVEADPAVLAEREKYFQEYCQNLRTLTDRLTAAGIKVVLLTPACYDQYRETGAECLVGCNEPGLMRFAEFVRTFAAEKGYPCIDFYTPMTELAKANPAFGVCISDRVHPGPAGQLFMGILLARDLGVSSQVASVTISGEKVEAENAVVSAFTRTGNQIKFTYAPKALPLSQKTDGYSKLNEVFPIADRINVEMLTVSDLPKGSYSLLANGKLVAVFDAKEFKSGINLALLETPSAVKSLEMFRLASEMKVAQQRQRGFAFCEIQLRRLGRVPGKNQKGDFKALEEWADKQKSKDFCQTIVTLYKNNVGTREQMQKNEADAREKMQAIMPEPFTIEIVPVQ